MKWLISKFIPSNAKLASQAAEAIGKGINGVTADKQAVIAKYAKLANECAAIGSTLTEILKDAKVDEMEQAKIAELIEPLFAKAREIIGL